MKANHRNYIFRETSVAIVINTTMNAMIGYLTFRDVEFIHQKTVIIDLVTQTFFVTFFAVLPGTLLTISRVRRCKIEPLAFPNIGLPNRPILRTMLICAVACLASALLHTAALTGLQIDGIARNALLTYKIIFSICLTLVIAPLALRIALSQSTATID